MDISPIFVLFLILVHFAVRYLKIENKGVLVAPRMV
nr:MAG TPA: hypothetical protein [Caudoviricetes sp.]